MSRIEMGEASLFAELRASGYWGSMAAEFFEGEVPFTEMGKLDHAFFAERKMASNHA
jgi:hypothetical protein